MFKKIGIAEAISFILLLGIAMPLKYMMDMPLMVKYVGWAHGVLFMAYLVSLYLTQEEQDWKLGFSALAFVASLVPFGPFILHRFIPERASNS